MSKDDAMRELLFCIELLFENDWEFTQINISHPETFIIEGATFLNPGVDDESNNWGNRGAFLKAYRDAKEAFALCAY